MKISTENDNNFGYEKITILVDNIPLIIRKNMIDWLIDWLILNVNFSSISGMSWGEQNL